VGLQASLVDGGLNKIHQLTQLEASNPAEGAEEEQKVVDPAAEVNKDKISPNCVNITRSQFKTVTEMLDLFRGVKDYPEDRKIGFIINDNKFDGTAASIVDIAVGTGCEYLNMKGFFRPEKIAKIQRYAEIYEEK
jgi:enolase